MDLQDARKFITRLPETLATAAMVGGRKGASWPGVATFPGESIDPLELVVERRVSTMIRWEIITPVDVESSTGRGWVEVGRASCSLVSKKGILCHLETLCGDVYIVSGLCDSGLASASLSNNLLENARLHHRLQCLPFPVPLGLSRHLENPFLPFLFGFRPLTADGQAQATTVSS